MRLKSRLLIIGIPFLGSIASTATPSELVVAQSAHAAVMSLGVNVHLEYLDTAYANVDKVIESLGFLGVYRVRDVTPSWLLGPFDTLAAKGYRFNFVTRASNVNDLQGSVLKTLADFQTRHPESIASLEGLNEVNLWPVSYGKLSGYGAAIAVQRDLMNGANLSPKLHNIPVVNLTLGGVGEDEYKKLGDMSALADLGNAHIYFQDNVPNWSWRYGLKLGASATPALRKTAVTETGYSTAVNHSAGVDERTQAVYTLHLILTAWEEAVDSLYLYQLVDHFHDATQKDLEAGFGLFRNDWTAKPAAVALRNLISALANGGAPHAAPRSLSYTISGASTARSLLLEEGDGTFDLIVWSERSVWDPAAAKPINPAPLDAMLAIDNFGGTVVAFDPLSGVRQTLSRSEKGIAFALRDGPLILEISATGPRPKPVQALRAY